MLTNNASQTFAANIIAYSLLLLTATATAAGPRETAQSMRSRIAFITDSMPLIKYMPDEARMRQLHYNERYVTVIEAGMVKLTDESPHSLFLVGADADTLYLTLMTPGKREAPGISRPISPTSQSQPRFTANANHESLADERLFLDQIKYAYGFTNPDEFDIAEPNYYIYRYKPPFYDQTSPQRSFRQSLQLAVDELARVNFINAWREMYYEDGIKAAESYRDLFAADIAGPPLHFGTLVREVGIVELSDRGPPSLFIAVQFSGTRESGLNLTLITPGKGGPVTAHLDWSCMDRQVAPTLRWCENSGQQEKAFGANSGADPEHQPWTRFAADAQYERELQFLSRITYAYGRISPHDISELADTEPAMSPYLWELENRRISRGPLAIRSHPASLPDPNYVMLTDGDITYFEQYNRGILRAYDRNTSQQHILYQTSSAWRPIRTVVKCEQWLLIGSQNGLAAIRQADAFIRTIPTDLKDVYEIKVTGSRISLNKGRHIIRLADLTAAP